ncbi:MAG TPA: hypothetical protein VME18_09910 [Acidobacteriaceae bacterium]|nr:hypothetical protein [Acidobacteriaceae bacterium]
MQGSNPRESRAHAIGVVLRIGLIAGTLDISENLVFNAFRHITPAMVFQYIASGLTGPWAFHAGSASILLGVAIHYVIAMAWTLIFYLASRRLTLLVRRPVMCGLAYGALVYLIMNLVVLPLARVPRAPVAMTLASRISGVLALLVCVGLTVALLTRQDREARQGRPAGRQKKFGRMRRSRGRWRGCVRCGSSRRRASPGISGGIPRRARRFAQARPG